jgi:tetratricopeptide (TPR) repeat protein
VRKAIEKALFLAGMCLMAALAVTAAADSLKPTLGPVNSALQAGQADKALSLLSALPQGGQNDAQAMNLSCRIRFTLAQWDSALRDCEEAVRLEPNNARHHMWLGRALGEKANKASFFTAFTLGKRVVAEFQKAAQLDPEDAEALADLGSFYVEAPSVVGGGMDKAQSVVAQLDRIDPARAYELRANIDIAHKDYASAEANLKKAVSLSRHPAFQWATLARFYEERKRWSDMDSALHSCMTAAARDPHAGVALYDAAGVLIMAKKEPALAAKLIQDYLGSSSKTEEAPAFVAYSRLALLQQEIGDAANAQANQAAAYELAREYQPAEDMRR